MFRDLLKIFVADSVVMPGLQGRLQHAAEMGLIELQAGMATLIRREGVRASPCVMAKPDPLSPVRTIARGPRARSSEARA
jgi:hypothetical protein